jgi:hypothetical protein
MDPMDMDISRSSTNISLIEGHFSLGELGLGDYTPSKSRNVANLNYLWFDKDSNKVILQKTKKLLVSEANPLLVKTKVEVIKNSNGEPFLIDSSNLSFMKESKKNMKNIAHEIEEKDEMIRSLEEEIQH